MLRTHRLTTKSSSAVFYNFPLASLLKGWPFINTKVKDAPVNCDNTLTHVKSHTSWGTAVCSGADPGGGREGRTPPPFIDNIGKKINFWIKYAPNCRKMHLKFQKFLGGMPSDPPGAHTCDERTASLSPTPHPPPFQNPGSAPDVKVYSLLLAIGTMSVMLTCGADKMKMAARFREWFWIGSVLIRLFSCHFHIHRNVIWC